MGASILVPILGALIGAGGSIGGGFLAGKGQEGPGIRAALTASGGDPTTDPVLAALAFESLLNFGFVDPSILQNASPAARARDAFEQSIGKQKRKERGFWALQSVLDQVFGGGRSVEEAVGNLSGKLQKGLFQLLSASGFDSIDQLVEAEGAFREQFGGFLDQAGITAQESLAARRDLQAERNAFLEGLDVLDLQELRDLEQERIDQRRGEQLQDILRLSNAANFNPGDLLTEFRRERREDPLQALNRAIALQQGGAAAQQAQLNLLNSGLADPVFQALAVGQNRVPGGGAAIAAPGGGSGALGQGVSSGLGGIGNIVSLLGLADLIGGGSGGSGAPGSTSGLGAADAAALISGG